ncbi:uncharacterized protein PV09_03559 [Verruconis gallopava]|uniref:RNA polymerase II subunit A C-terminal domain phosphatase n=1 Tax=Verruconis gallopava TaxID=253628 RepID=A0A0D2B307_9PEZI|nr:uncharacterized protein PV09_03559 [Verruconis gallopava]KIW05699.1 hypothetical protein PV09_03559 [Verruconis gallopava]
MIICTTSQHYPITVSKLLVQPGAEVSLFDALFKYTYKSPVIEGDKYGDEHEVLKTFPEEFKSETSGTVRQWFIKVGDVLTRPGIRIVEIEEPCSHEELFGNLCVICGVDVTQLDNYLTSRPNASRATVATSHNNTALKVSERVANTRSEELTRRLLESRKLSLVVDLDQTIIHATVDPTVAEWQKDPDNPNYDAVKDVKAFQLLDDGPGMRGCWYYIKLRPGLDQFLQAIAKKYELHIYTMGTRAYAQNIAKIVDPQHKIFGDRILSRDESGSMTAKNLHRLFPVTTDMVVIIDDRGDVWHWNANLVKVSPYDFFVGIGDINSSFLPKTQGAVPKPKVGRTVATNGGAPAAGNLADKGKERVLDTQSADNGDMAPDDEDSDLGAQIVAMAGSGTDADFTAQTEAQEELIATQLEDRPLLRRQEALDQLDEAEDVNGDGSETSSEHSQRHRHNLLRDDDDELQYLQKHLEDVHRAFFEEFDARKRRMAAGRVAELRGDKTSPKKAPVVDDLELVPDVKVIMPAMKRQVLQGVVICFTGVIPQGIDHKKSDLGMWAQSFGARINTHLTKSTTHVIAHKDRRTSKVRQATQHPRIQIVSVSWLYECFSRWEHVDEGPHTIEFDRDAGHHDSLPFDEFEEGVILTPSEDGEEISDLPDDQEGEPLSPTFEKGEMDWKEANDELKEFMGSDDESEFDEGSESDASNASISSSRSETQTRKRKRTPSSVDGEREGEDADGSASGGVNGSALQKRRKKASERTTGLTNVTVASESSGLPSPETTGPEEGNGVANGAEDDMEEEVEGQGEGEGEEDEDGGDIDEEDDDDFAKMMEEAMASASDDEEDVES